MYGCFGNFFSEDPGIVRSLAMKKHALPCFGTQVRTVYLQCSKYTVISQMSHLTMVTVDCPIF